MKNRKGLNIRSIDHLCKQLGTSPAEIDKLTKHIGHYYNTFYQKKRNGDPRRIDEPLPRLKQIMQNLQDRMQRLELPGYIQGGRRGYSNISNARVHIGQPAILKLDIENCFPSISSGRVYDVFNRDLDCHPNVARMLTRLTTFNGCLPQGAPTSSIICAFTLGPLARRLYRLSKYHKARFTLYVDDITFSGGLKIDKLKPKIIKIMKQERFNVKEDKIEVICNPHEQTVTGPRVNDGVDISGKGMNEIRTMFNYLKAKVEDGDILDETEVRSFEGKLANLSRLNKGAGKTYKRKWAKILPPSSRLSQPKPFRIEL